MTLGQSIIRDVCMQFVVDRDELLSGGKRDAAVTKARGAAIVRMKEHFSLHQIARMLRIHKSAVSYHLYQARRENVRRNAAACVARKRTAQLAEADA